MTYSNDIHEGGLSAVLESNKCQLHLGLMIRAENVMWCKHLIFWNGGCIHFDAGGSVRWYLKEKTPEPVKYRLDDRRHSLLLCVCRCCRCFVVCC